jgi:hypothetical protein
MEEKKACIVEMGDIFVGGKLCEPVIKLLKMITFEGKLEGRVHVGLKLV